MIEKFAGAPGLVASEFLDLNHTSEFMKLVSLLIPKLAREGGIEQWRASESGHQAGSVMTAKRGRML